MEVFFREENWVKSKIVASADACGVAVTFSEMTASVAESLPRPAEVALSTPQGFVCGANAILRYVARLNPSHDLIGRSALEEASVDQWLETVWNEIEVTAYLLKLDAKDQAPGAGPAVAQAKADLRAALARVDGVLAARQYLATERFSIADIALCAVLLDLKKTSDKLSLPSILAKTACPHLSRWLATCSLRPCLAKLFPGAGGATSVVGAAPSWQAVAGIPPPRTGNAAADAPCSTAFAAVKVPKGRFKRDRVRVKELLALGAGAIGKTVVVKGWARTVRLAAKNRLCFIELNDGSCLAGLQVVATAGEAAGFEGLLTCGGTGCSLSVAGVLIKSPKEGQPVELQASSVQVLGSVEDPATYPMAKKAHTLEYLREQAHLRPRTRIYSALARVRHALAFATNKFFNDHGFLYVHTPLITTADCEGAGEQFTVTTLLPEELRPEDLPTTPAGQVDFTKDFFGRRANLTVSGQLNVETHCCALGDVYTFGPTFRAENSHTARHLAEFWMIEPEIAFADLATDIDLAEDYLKYCVRYALEHCQEDLAFFEDNPHGEKGLRARLQNVIAEPFERLTYTAAIELLQQHVAEGKRTFEEYPEWGIDLGSEHERYLAEDVFRKPVVLTDYPKGIKAVYMRLNDDNETVAAADVLAPKIGEVIGGSQREERLDVLERRCLECGLALEHVDFYVQLRKYGTIQHAGFGLGFERLLMLVTGLNNIRDVIPFMRVPGSARF